MTIASTALNADPLDRAQAEVDLPFLANPERDSTLVDVRRQHLDAHPPAVVDVLDEELVALGAVHLRGQHRGHVLGGIMSLQIGGLVGHQRIGRAVRLVEAVAAEIFDQVEDLQRLLSIQPALDGPLDELVTALGDDVGLLLRDRLDRGIGLGELDATQPVEDPHHLFLVDHHPVGFFQHLLEHGVKVGRLLPAVLDVDVLVDHAAVERARPVKRIGGDDVGEPVGLHLDQEVANARADSSWKTPLVSPRCKSSKVLRSSRGSRSRSIGRLGMPLVDDPHGRFQGGQVAQAEEVHLEQPGLLDVAHLPLGADDSRPCRPGG